MIIMIKVRWSACDTIFHFQRKDTQAIVLVLSRPGVAISNKRHSHVDPAEDHNLAPTESHALELGGQHESLEKAEQARGRPPETKRKLSESCKTVYQEDGQRIQAYVW